MLELLPCQPACPSGQIKQGADKTLSSSSTVPAEQYSPSYGLTPTHSSPAVVHPGQVNSNVKQTHESLYLESSVAVMVWLNEQKVKFFEDIGDFVW